VRLRRILERPISRTSLLKLLFPFSVGRLRFVSGREFPAGRYSFYNPPSLRFPAIEQQGGGGWQTLVTATVEGLTFLTSSTADRMSAQISTEHPLEGDDPKVSFFRHDIRKPANCGCPINVTLDLDVCQTGDPINILSAAMRE